MHKIPHLLLLLTLTTLLTPTTPITLFNKIQISNKTGAACLDGTNPAFYLWVPDDLDTPVNKVLVYFDETPFGWCVREDLAGSLEECYRFLTESNLNQHASSKDWAGSFMVLSGILSPFDGGEFSMWTKVIIKSCDAGAYMGNRDPIQYKKHKLHFKGSLNVEQVFKYLQSKKLLSNREQIVLAGSLNGAIAAMNWVEVFKQYTSSPVRLLLDSAIHLNQYNRKNNRTEYENRMKMLQKLFLNDAATPSKGCSIANQQQPWRCLFGIQLQKHLAIPTFYTQSLYDGWAIDAILGFKCAQQFASLSQCEQWQKQTIKQYHKNLTAILHEISQKQGNGMFAIACVAHEFVKGRWNNDMFEVPMNSGNLVINVTGNWIKKKGSFVQVDQVQWPGNRPCARKLGGLRRGGGGGRMGRVGTVGLVE